MGIDYDAKRAGYELRSAVSLSVRRTKRTKNIATSKKDQMTFEIVPRLFLGSATDAEHASTDVKLVVNCTKNLPFFSSSDLVHQIRVPVDDSPDECDTIVQYWIDPELFDAIDDHIVQGHDVLVHCQMGRQRSAATVVAYLLRRGWSLTRAIAFVKSRKIDAFFPEVNFMDALVKFNGHLHKLVCV